MAGLDDAQRRALARQDAARGYTDRTPYWGSLLITAYGSPLLGWLVPACTVPPPVPAYKLQAPYPERLADPTYRAAYHQAAQRRKRSLAWGGSWHGGKRVDGADRGRGDGCTIAPGRKLGSKDLRNKQNAVARVWPEQAWYLVAWPAATRATR